MPEMSTVETRKNFDDLHFITNELFTIETKSKDKTNVYRTCDGELVCSLNIKMCAYVRKSITPEHNDSEITGIYDVITKRIFKSNMQTLLHFGAKNLVLGCSDLGSLRTDKEIKAQDKNLEKK